MIGVIRDEDTAEIAIRAAITGHLVLSTLHTNNASGAVIRLIDMGVQKYLVADAMVGVISQRLVRTLCPECKGGHITTKAEMELLGISEPRKIFVPKGCPYCNNTGYKGRTAVHEILYIDDEIRFLIEKGESLEVIEKHATKSGMLNLQEVCAKKVLKGITSIEELVGISYDS
jgi:type IV pilus assembly protein PilB